MSKATPLCCSRFCSVVVALYFSSVAVGQGRWDEIEFRQLPNPLERRELDLQARPVTANDLAAWYALPRGAVNNTALWLKASNSLPEYFFQIPEMTRGIPLVDWQDDGDVPDELSVEIVQRATNLLEMYKDNLIAGVRAAEAGGYCEFDVDFSAGIGSNVGALYRLVSLSRLLALAAIVAEHQRASKDTVFTYLFAANRCLRMLDGFPTAAASIARNAASMRGQHLAVQLVDRFEFTGQQLQTLMEEIRMAGKYSAFRIALIGDRVLGNYAFDDTSSTIDIMYGVIDYNTELGISDASSVKPATLQKMKRFAARYAEEDRLYFREAMDALLEIADLPYHLAYNELAKLEAELKSDEMAKRRGVKSLLTPNLLPLVEINKRLQVDAEATNELANGILAMKLFHLRSGRLPHDFSDLIPEYLEKQPQDSWTGRNVATRWSGKTLEISSAGKNQIFEPDATESDDLVFKVRF